MASEWPVFVALPRDVLHDRDHWVWDKHCEKPTNIGDVEWERYIHRDAARAWQAFRDWLNFGESRNG